MHHLEPAAHVPLQVAFEPRVPEACQRARDGRGKGTQPGERRIAQVAGVDQRAAGDEFEEPQVPHGVPGVGGQLQGVAVQSRQHPRRRNPAAGGAGGEERNGLVLGAELGLAKDGVVELQDVASARRAEVSRKFRSWLLPSSTASASSPKKRSASTAACRSSTTGRTNGMVPAAGL